MANSLVNICMIGSFSYLHLFLLTRIIALALFLFESSQNCFTSLPFRCNSATFIIAIRTLYARIKYERTTAIEVAALTTKSFLKPMISKNVSILNYWSSQLFFQMQININEPLALRGSLKFLAAHVQPFRAQLAMVHTRTRLFHQGF